ncbi:MAG: polysaccharide deacetylase family protein [Candidatus Heimdallarchaeota archaeon]|nr:MAG: polysaccharide deacetylase family protein [Candidatus Heimdallarchaeota archaeon]
MSLENTQIPFVVVLHAYQPPTQKASILDRIIKNCYLPVAQALENNPNLKITLNMNASLTEMLEDDYLVVVEKYAELARNGQVEFLDSGAYHPILPLISPKEARKQIKMNRKINSSIFGNVWKPRGLWPPELAVSETLATLVESLGYEYMIVPEIAISSNSPFPTPLLTRLPIHPSAPKLFLINRNREVSNNISFRKYPSYRNALEHFGQLRNVQPEGILVFASDLETFGEHHPKYEIFLTQILQSTNTQTVSEILTLPRQPIVEFRSSSWSTSEEDIYRDIPYPLWAYPGNSIHELLNFHSDLLSETLEFLLAEKDEAEYEVKMALKAVAKAQHSCQTWWASARDQYNTELIRKGFDAQRAALDLTLMAIGSESEHPIPKGLSDRISKRLERYLSRFR